MTLTIHEDVVQGTIEWEALRRGIVTASVVESIVTKGPPSATSVTCPICWADPDSPCMSTARKVPTPIKTIHEDRTAVARNQPPVFRVAENETSRGLIMTLAAERITDHTEETRGSWDMQRGTMDEPYARDAYSEQYEKAREAGFMTLQLDDFKLGYSPDGLVGADGLIEIKSRLQKIQLQTVLRDEVPAANMAQIQTGLLVSGRKWCDYVSYCGGMPLWVKRVEPDPDWQLAILDSAQYVEKAIAEVISDYEQRVAGLPLTERIDHYEGMQL